MIEFDEPFNILQHAESNLLLRRALNTDVEDSAKNFMAIAAKIRCEQLEKAEVLGEKTPKSPPLEWFSKSASKLELYDPGEDPNIDFPIFTLGSLVTFKRSDFCTWSFGVYTCFDNILTYNFQTNRMEYLSYKENHYTEVKGIIFEEFVNGYFLSEPE